MKGKSFVAVFVLLLLSACAGCGRKARTRFLEARAARPDTYICLLAAQGAGAETGTLLRNELRRLQDTPTRTAKAVVLVPLQADSTPALDPACDRDVVTAVCEAREADAVVFVRRSPESTSVVVREGYTGAVLWKRTFDDPSDEERARRIALSLVRLAQEAVEFESACLDNLRWLSGSGAPPRVTSPNRTIPPPSYDSGIEQLRVEAGFEIQQPAWGNGRIRFAALPLRYAGTRWRMEILEYESPSAAVETALQRHGRRADELLDGCETWYGDPPECVIGRFGIILHPQEDDATQAFRLPERRRGLERGIFERLARANRRVREYYAEHPSPPPSVEIRKTSSIVRERVRTVEIPRYVVPRIEIRIDGRLLSLVETARTSDTVVMSASLKEDGARTSTPGREEERLEERKRRNEGDGRDTGAGADSRPEESGAAEQGPAPAGDEGGSAAHWELKFDLFRRYLAMDRIEEAAAIAVEMEKGRAPSGLLSRVRRLLHRQEEAEATPADDRAQPHAPQGSRSEQERRSDAESKSSRDSSPDPENMTVRTPLQPVEPVERTEAVSPDTNEATPAKDGKELRPPGAPEGGAAPRRRRGLWILLAAIMTASAGLVLLRTVR